MNTKTIYNPENHEVPQVVETDADKTQTVEVLYQNSPESYHDFEAPETVEELERGFTKVAEFRKGADQDPLSGVFHAMQGRSWSNPETLDEETHEKIQEHIRGSDTSHTSMSVGDLIRKGDVLYMVEGVGFTELEVQDDGSIEEVSDDE